MALRQNDSASCRRKPVVASLAIERGRQQTRKNLYKLALLNPIAIKRSL
jgi:hypothetical protein